MITAADYPLYRDVPGRWEADVRQAAADVVVLCERASKRRVVPWDGTDAGTDQLLAALEASPEVVAALAQVRAVAGAALPDEATVTNAATALETLLAFLAEKAV